MASIRFKGQWHEPGDCIYYEEGDRVILARSNFVVQIEEVLDDGRYIVRYNDGHFCKIDEDQISMPEAGQ